MPARVRIDRPAANMEQVLGEAGRLFSACDGLEATEVTRMLAARELVGSTSLGHGVAIPHARMSGLRQALAGFIRTRLAVDFNAPDGKPVSEFLVVLVPAGAGEEHLQLLADAARMFDDRRFREYLRGLDSTEGVYRAFVDWPRIPE